MKILEWDNILLVMVALICVYLILSGEHQVKEWNRIVDLKTDSLRMVHNKAKKPNIAQRYSVIIPRPK